MSAGTRLARSARAVWNDTITSDVPRRGSPGPPHRRAGRAIANPSACTEHGEAVLRSLMPSFFASGVPEYPATWATLPYASPDARARGTSR